jgi:hypothetical protein
LIQFFTCFSAYAASVSMVMKPFPFVAALHFSASRIASVRTPLPRLSYPTSPWAMASTACP